MSIKKHLIKSYQAIILGLYFAVTVVICFLAFHTTKIKAQTSLAPEISRGERIIIKDKGFSIVPPNGWEIHHDYPGTSLMMQVPYKRTIPYQRTIQVMVFSDVRYIDEITAREFKKILVDKMSATMVPQDYRVRNSLPIFLANGQKAILFYSEFTLENTPMMQATVLCSSAINHFILTFTDLATNFEAESGENVILTQAWQSMISIQTDTSTPGRFDVPLTLGIGIGAFLALYLLIWLIRHVTAGSRYRQYLDETPLKETSKEATWAEDGEKKKAPGQFRSAMNYLSRNLKKKINDKQIPEEEDIALDFDDDNETVSEKEDQDEKVS